MARQPKAEGDVRGNGVEAEGKVKTGGFRSQGRDVQLSRLLWCARGRSTGQLASSMTWRKRGNERYVVRIRGAAAFPTSWVITSGCVFGYDALSRCPATKTGPRNDHQSWQSLQDAVWLLYHSPTAAKLNLHFDTTFGISSTVCRSRSHVGWKDLPRLMIGC